MLRFVAVTSVAVTLALTLALGCGTSRDRARGGVDAGGRDSGTLDVDGGRPAPDGGVDAGARDSGASDAGAPDSGPPDSGPADAGPPDAGPGGSCPSGSSIAGPRSARAGANLATVGTRAWQSVGAITASDASGSSRSGRAYVSALVSSEVSNYLVATDFGFSIPSAARIDGIVFDYERRSLSGVGVVDDAVRSVRRGAIGTADRAMPGRWTSSETTASYGSASDRWGQTWTAAEVNASDFGTAMSLRYESRAGNDWPYVDHVQATVHYTCP